MATWFASACSALQVPPTWTRRNAPLKSARSTRRTWRPANRLETDPGPDTAALLATLAATLDRLRPQALTMRRDILAGLAAELGWTMRRRPSLLVGIPRPRGH